MKNKIEIKQTMDGVNGEFSFEIKISDDGVVLIVDGRVCASLEEFRRGIRTNLPVPRFKPGGVTNEALPVANVDGFEPIVITRSDIDNISVSATEMEMLRGGLVDGQPAEILNHIPKTIPGKWNNTDGRFLFFAHDDEPRGGLSDLENSFNNLQDAKKAFRESKMEFRELYDRIVGMEVDMNE